MMSMMQSSPPAEQDCPVCHGVGFVCVGCNKPDGDCICEDEDGDIVPCPECNEP